VLTLSQKVDECKPLPCTPLIPARAASSVPGGAVEASGCVSIDLAATLVLTSYPIGAVCCCASHASPVCRRPPPSPPVAWTVRCTCLYAAAAAAGGMAAAMSSRGAAACVRRVRWFPDTPSSHPRQSGNDLHLLSHQSPGHVYAPRHQGRHAPRIRQLSRRRRDSTNLQASEPSTGGPYFSHRTELGTRSHTRGTKMGWVNVGS